MPRQPTDSSFLDFSFFQYLVLHSEVTSHWYLHGQLQKGKFCLSTRWGDVSQHAMDRGMYPSMQLGRWGDVTRGCMPPLWSTRGMYASYQNAFLLIFNPNLIPLIPSNGFLRLSPLASDSLSNRIFHKLDEIGNNANIGIKGFIYYTKKIQ